MHDTLPLPTGRGRPHRVYNQGLVYPVKRLRLPPLGIPPDWGAPLGRWKHNDVLYSWASIVGPQLTDGERKYRIAGMYIEFQNVADPDDPIALPTVSREIGRDYYDALGDSDDTDYLRVPLTGVRADTSDENLFPIALGGNVLTFFAQTSGVEGVHGKPFSDSNNSKIFGGALVAMLDEEDDLQDRILSRLYLDTDSQVAKQPTGQVGLEWELTLG